MTAPDNDEPDVDNSGKHALSEAERRALRGEYRSMPVSRHRVRRSFYALRRPIWSARWVTFSFRLWRRDGFGRCGALLRSVVVSLPCAAWHATGCNRVKEARRG